MNICLYGASSEKTAKTYIDAVEELGRKIGERGHGLVFGGGANGLMGAAARGVRETGGAIIGVVPHFLDRDGVLFQNCTEMICTDTMRERKQIMEDRADGFVMTPGGIGTFEEFFEIFTLKQLGRHTKPIAVYNLCGYYDALKALLDKAVSEDFLKRESLGLFRLCGTAGEILDYLEQSGGEKRAAPSFT